jgi:hypothetical protein
MTEAEILWNDLKFCTKRREEQGQYLMELYVKLYKKQISEERFTELYPSAFDTMIKFRERVNELRRN